MKQTPVSVVAQLDIMTEQRDALDRQIQSLKTAAESIKIICDLVREEAKKTGVPLVEIAYALAPEIGRAKAKSSQNSASASTGRLRAVKRYKNPHNGEVIETKGGNHKLLKEWKAKWGKDVVEGWLEKS